MADNGGNPFDDGLRAVASGLERLAEQAPANQTAIQRLTEAIGRQAAAATSFPGGRLAGGGGGSAAGEFALAAMAAQREQATRSQAPQRRNVAAPPPPAAEAAAPAPVAAAETGTREESAAENESRINKRFAAGLRKTSRSLRAQLEEDRRDSPENVATTTKDLEAVQRTRRDNLQERLAERAEKQRSRLAAPPPAPPAAKDGGAGGPPADSTPGAAPAPGLGGTVGKLVGALQLLDLGEHLARPGTAAVRGNADTYFQIQREGEDFRSQFLNRTGLRELAETVGDEAFGIQPPTRDDSGALRPGGFFSPEQNPLQQILPSLLGYSYDKQVHGERTFKDSLGKEHLFTRQAGKEF